MGCQDDVTLAQRVVVASPEERLAMLREMYRCHHDNALHEVLDNILSKPADPPEDAVGECGPDKAPAKSPAVKSQPRKGGYNRLLLHLHLPLPYVTLKLTRSTSWMSSHLCCFVFLNTLCHML